MASAYRPYSASANAGVAVANVVEVDLQPPPGYDWNVSQIGIESLSITGCECTVFLDQRFICGSASGIQDSADGSPVPVRNTSTLRIVWSGVSAGAQCSAHILVQEAPISDHILTAA